MKKTDTNDSALTGYSVKPTQNMFDDTMMRRLYICMGWFLLDLVFFLGALAKSNADMWLMFNVIAFGLLLVAITRKHWPEKKVPDRTDGDE